MTTAFLVASHQMMVQFCSNGVTGTMIAPAFALPSALVSVFSVMALSMPIFDGPPSQSFVLFDRKSRAPIAAVTPVPRSDRTLCRTFGASSALPRNAFLLEAAFER
jgi:hypothetical protein